MKKPNSNLVLWLPLAYLGNNRLHADTKLANRLLEKESLTIVLTFPVEVAVSVRERLSSCTLVLLFFIDYCSARSITSGKASPVRAHIKAGCFFLGLK